MQDSLAALQAAILRLVHDHILPEDSASAAQGASSTAGGGATFCHSRHLFLVRSTCAKVS